MGSPLAPPVMMIQTLSPRSYLPPLASEPRRRKSDSKGEALITKRS